jgi:glycosyltransferase involved in cell wall biosynthesis
MKILMLAPHPFYQPRGTPIAVDLVLRVLSEQGEKVDLITFPEGSEVSYANVNIYRTPAIVKNIRPGFSLKKLICDGFMLIQAFGMARKQRYDLIHAGEEAVFIALLIHKITGIPYLYDMDSSLVQQLIDKKPSLKVFKKLFQACERLAVRHAKAVMAVCPALATEIAPYRPYKAVVIPDISLLNSSSDPANRDQTEPGPALSPVDQLKAQFQIGGPLLMYVGNLESYQGIDLMIDSFAEVLPAAPTAHLIAIGGAPSDVQKYQALAEQRRLSANVHFIGSRPITQLKQYLEQADILLSPRTQGNNTPMKLYSYLDSGKALLATNLATHTQVLDVATAGPIAWLAEPRVAAFAGGMLHLIEHPELRQSLGQAAQAYIAQEHTYEAFSRKLTALYRWLKSELPSDPSSDPPSDPNIAVMARSH